MFSLVTVEVLNSQNEISTAPQALECGICYTRVIGFIFDYFSEFEVLYWRSMWFSLLVDFGQHLEFEYSDWFYIIKKGW